MTAAVLGIDVSRYQAHTPPLKGLSFGWARAVYDVYPDQSYPMHVANFRKARLVVGAYAFGTGRDTPENQARSFLAVAHDADLLALDLENDAIPMSQPQARAFIAYVQSRGRRIGLYHSDSGFPDVGQDFNWVARWGSGPPKRTWSFWQYRGSPLDLDRFNGTKAELIALTVTLPESSTEAPMQGFNFIQGKTTSGTFTVSEKGHAYQRLLDGSLHGPIIPGPDWTDRPALGPVKLLIPIPGGKPGADRSTVYITGVEAAALLASDVTFKPSAAADCSGAVAAEHERVRAAAIKKAEEL